MTGPDLAALRAEERAAAGQATPDAYRELLARRLAGKPVVLDVDLLEQVIADRPWADALRPVAGPILVQSDRPADTVIFVNTFPRVPTAAAETLLVNGLGLRRDSLHSANGGFDNGFDRLTALRAFRAKSLVRGHVTATVRVRACLALLGIRPILLVRDIFDTIAWYAADRSHPAVAPGYRIDGIAPDGRERIRVLRMASQLVDFYASWRAAEALGFCTVHRWEALHLDWPGFLVERFAEHGRAVDRATVAEVLGTLPPDPYAGPGLGTALSDESRALVRSLYAQYPALDFRPIDAGAAAPA